MYEHILVTGGAGFVGSALALDCKSRFPHARVTAFDNLMRRGSELNLPRLRAGMVDFQHGDVRCREDLERLPHVDLILECSAEPSVLSGYGGSPEYLIQTNLNGCFRCLELARRDHAAFILLSTSRVYPIAALNSLDFEETESRFTLAPRQSAPGASARGISEDFPLHGSRSLYGMTKLAGELLVEEYRAAYGLRTVVNRCGVIAGPGQMGKTDQGVVVLWMAAHYFRQPLNYIGFDGTGRQVRDILAIEDLCDLIGDQTTGLEKYDGRCLNAGGGNASSLSLLEMTRLCAEITGHRLDIGRISQDRVADLRLYISDHAKLTAVNGWSPRRDPRHILTSIFEWLRREEAMLRPILFPNPA